MRSISRHIMPLVINDLGGGHTHTHTHANTHIHIQTIRTKAILQNQAHAGRRPVRAWFKKCGTFCTCVGRDNKIATSA